MTLAEQAASIATTVDRVIADRNKAEQKLHNLETALLLIIATSTDQNTIAIAESALEILNGAP